MKLEARSSAGIAWALVCALSLSNLPSSALAQAPAATNDELTAARESFKKGVELEKLGKYDEALEKFEATAKVKITAQVRFHIGLCNDKLGRLGTAIDAYDAAAKQAEIEGNAPEVLKVAPGLAEKLRAERPKLTVTFANDQAPDTLEIDGRAIEGNVAKDYPLDPGAHVVIASKSGSSERREITLERGDNKTLTIELSSAATDPPPTYDHPSEHPRDRPVATPTSSNNKRAIGWAVGGFGVVSLALAGAFYVVRTRALDELEGACTGDLRCPPSSKETYDRAKTFTTLSGVALGVGVAAVSVSAVLLFTGRPKPEEPKTAGARFVPYAPNANLFGFGIEGAF